MPFTSTPMRCAPTSTRTSDFPSARIEHGLREFEGRFVVVPLPNISHIFYGRDVGYRIERIELNETLEQVSATEARRRMGAKPS
jgi:adenylylsulfate kinase